MIVEVLNQLTVTDFVVSRKPATVSGINISCPLDHYFFYQLCKVKTLVMIFTISNRVWYWKFGWHFAVPNPWRFDHTTYNLICTIQVVSIVKVTTF